MDNLESTLSIVVIIIGTISAIFSGFLAFLVLRVRPTYLARYQHILVAIALTGVCYSICEICTVPYWYVSDGDFVLFAVGPIQSRRVSQALLYAFAISFMESLFLISYSFAFQYAQVCRSEWFRTFQFLIYIPPLINFIIISNWLLAVTYCFAPTEQKIKKATEFVWEHLKIKIGHRASLGFSLEIQKFDTLFYIFILNILILILILFFTIIISANRIIAKVSSDLSNRNQFSSIYRLLFVQCISPTLFTIFPLTFNVITGILGINLGQKIPFVLASLLPMYPAVNTILIIWQIKDYRNYFRFCNRKDRRISVVGRRKSVIISI
ncbi:Seven TM Receptor [Caenorhabditis elegans]|uniref:Seven TM Receptor n=1 Tax=Caenorhabditis elegans TaxID=6239 RepID=A0A0K3AS76_CAEEL|nr:Seven TM Receptor [Caenorhabditis elegans]CTQ86846.1 Seven TM Receptor [Caenorhabditis elegans]|eukprot:NP_001300147.1 Uncharacterized protein CELE_K10C9.4 [Caenorhabditis elegans]